MARKKRHTALYGKEAWLLAYRTGVEAGAEKYRAKVPIMSTGYSVWIDHVFDQVVATLATLPAKVEGGDPADNYARRGAPFARLFKRLAEDYKRKKAEAIRRVVTPIPAPVATPAPAR